MTNDGRLMISTDEFRPTLSASQERRGYRRVSLSVHGRYMLEDRREFPCQTLDIAPDGVDLLAPTSGEIGSRVIVYLDNIGRVEGTVLREIENGFSMSINAPPSKQEKLAGQIAWLVNRQALGVPENRRHQRLELHHSETVLTFKDGRRIPATIIDCSISGAALDCAQPIELGTELAVGECDAQVVRQFEGGIAVAFATPIPPERFGPDLVL